MIRENVFDIEGVVDAQRRKDQSDMYCYPAAQHQEQAQSSCQSDYCDGQPVDKIYKGGPSPNRPLESPQAGGEHLPKIYSKWLPFPDDP